MERTRNALNRTVRASTPTNIKIKEWFQTINHKFNRIKKQTQEVLHHRHHPLIQDQYECSGLSGLSLPSDYRPFSNQIDARLSMAANVDSAEPNG